MALKFVFLLFVLSRAASGEDVLPVVPGDDATLLCDAGNASIRAVEWTRSDLKSEYVLLYIDENSDTTHQHPSFADRVQLVDAELKKGNVSLILKNVNNNDAGTYECRVAAGGSGRTKRAVGGDPIRIIKLEVTGSASKNENAMNENTVDGNTMDGNAHKHVGLAAGGLVCSAVVVVGLVIRRKSKRQSDRNSEPAAADEADVELV